MDFVFIAIYFKCITYIPASVYTYAISSIPILFGFCSIVILTRKVFFNYILREGLPMHFISFYGTQMILEQWHLLLSVDYHLSHQNISSLEAHILFTALPLILRIISIRWEALNLCLEKIGNLNTK